MDRDLMSIKKVIILGSTGSIGLQALDVIAKSEDFEIVGLSAGTRWRQLIDQAKQYSVKQIVLTDLEGIERAQAELQESDIDLLTGPEGIIELITETDADLVLNAIVGFAGLGPTVVTLGEGIDLALANKESLVVGGELVMALAEATGAQILPVDSEHAALHQLVSPLSPGILEKLTLTASGGPFRGLDRDALSQVSVSDALRHPTWQMGGKITIDSATLMNKGLELIEAHHLFAVDYKDLEVVVHPESIVHALVELCDGSQLAHLGMPDMRVPIAYALHYPDRVDLPVEKLSLAKSGSLTFEEADEATFSCLRLARSAGIEGGTAPCILNAANEIAVESFLEGKIAFTSIAEVVERALDGLASGSLHSFDMLYDVDRKTRSLARKLVTEVK